MNEPIVTEPPSSAPPPSASSSRGTISLVLGILGLLCCALLGPVAWYLGSQELKAIAAGESPATGEGVAKAGMILGIIGSVLLILGLIWVFVFGGMAVVGGLMES